MKRIDIKGVVVPNDEKWIYDLFEYESVTPKEVLSTLSDANGEEIEVIINSGGGDVFAGSEIYTAIKEYSGQSTVKIVGIAASIASVIAMAGDKVLISPTAQMMLHNVSMQTAGDYRDMEHAAGVLQGANKTIANAYMLKTGLEEKEILAMMNKETWFTPQEAVEKGFVDEVMFDNQIRLVASQGGLLPREVIDKMQKQSAGIKKAQAQLNLIKLGGKT